MIVVTLPDGNEVEFPKGTSKDTINSAISKNFPQFAPKQQTAPFDTGRAARLGIEKGLSLGFRPVIAGLGAAAGSTLGELQQNRGLMDAIRSGMKAFGEGRKEAVEEEAMASEKAPIVSALSEVGGSLLTLPFAPVRGLKGAAALGGVMGLGKGLSEAESIADVPKEVAKGALTGAAIEGTTKGLGAIARKVAGPVKKGAKTVVSKIGSTATGVPERDIKTLIEKGDDVARIIKESGGDLTAEADNLRRNLANAIKATKKKANDSISKAIENAPSDKRINTAKAFNAIDKVKNGLDKVVNRKDLKAIDKKIINEINMASKKGGLSLKSAQALKQEFDTLSAPTYVKDGKIYANSSGVRRAGKAAADELRGPIAELSPEIGKSNKILSKFHKIENKINKNLIAEGKPDVSLFAAGSGTHKRNASMLGELGEMTGTKPLEEAQKLSAASSFSGTKILPIDKTGRSYTRLAASTGLGGALGGGFGVAAGALASSPTVLKNAIRAGQVTSKNAGKLFKIANPQVKSLLIQTFGKESFPGVDPAMQTFIEALKRSPRKDNKE